MLRALAAAGWLAGADLAAPLARTRKLLASTGNHIREMKEAVELLSAQTKLWSEAIRPAVVATLATQEQLVPEMMELIAAYLDIQESQPAAAAAAAAAQP